MKNNRSLISLNFFDSLPDYLRTEIENFSPKNKSDYLALQKKFLNLIPGWIKGLSDAYLLDGIMDGEQTMDLRKRMLSELLGRKVLTVNLLNDLWKSIKQTRENQELRKLLADVENDQYGKFAEWKENERKNRGY